MENQRLSWASEWTRWPDLWKGDIGCSTDLHALPGQLERNPPKPSPAGVQVGHAGSDWLKHPAGTGRDTCPGVADSTSHTLLPSPWMMHPASPSHGSLRKAELPQNYPIGQEKEISKFFVLQSFLRRQDITGHTSGADPRKTRLLGLASYIVIAFRLPLILIR